MKCRVRSNFTQSQCSVDDPLMCDSHGVLLHTAQHVAATRSGSAVVRWVTKLAKWGSSLVPVKKKEKEKGKKRKCKENQRVSTKAGI